MKNSCDSYWKVVLTIQISSISMLLELSGLRFWLGGWSLKLSVLKYLNISLLDIAPQSIDFKPGIDKTGTRFPLRMETDFRPVDGHPRPTFIGPKSGHLVNLDPRIEKRDLQIANTDRITGCTLNLLLNFRLERLPNARCIDGKDDTRQDASQNTKRYDDIALHASSNS